MTRENDGRASIAASASERGAERDRVEPQRRHRRDRREDPDDEQPWAELGLKSDEYRIRDILGRRPTTAELAMYSVMWSEHCSAKSSKVHLRSSATSRTARRCSSASARTRRGRRRRRLRGHLQGRVAQPPELRRAVPGRGHRRRRHRPRHPHHGRPPDRGHGLARFGRADAPDTARVLPMPPRRRGYGNCLGLPNIGGELLFDGAGTAGQRAVRRRHAARGRPLAKAEGVGNKVILFGARTGGDGIGGVSVLASDLRRARSRQAAQRPGGRPVHREAAHRGVPGDLRRRPRHRHPGPGGAGLRDVRAGQRRYRRHACRPRPSRCATARSPRPRS